MKIALVSPYDYACPGGVNTHISGLACQFAKMGHQVRILAPCSNRKALTRDQDIIPVGKTIPFPSNGSIARVTLSGWLMPKVKKVLEEERFDIIHLHEPFCPMLPWIVLRLSNSINVGTFHAYYERSRGYWVGRPFLNQFLDRLDGKIAVSEPALRCITRYFPGHYRLIPHGIDLENFAAETSPMEQFCDGKLNILFVSRLEKRKGLGYLLQAYEQVKREYPYLRLIVVGPDGGLRRSYEKRIKERKLPDVVLAGYVSSADLPRYYHTADIFCAPAVGKESFGIILLEAMATGKPIIASNIGGYARVVTHGVEGLLVPPKDEQALAQALFRLVDDQGLRQQMGAKGRIKTEEHSWQSIAQRTLDYYTELSGGEVKS